MKKVSQKKKKKSLRLKNLRKKRSLRLKNLRKEEEPIEYGPKESVRIVQPVIAPVIEPKVESKAEVNTDLGKDKVKKKHNKRNGKLGINKDNENAYVPTIVRKACNNCKSTNHLTHICKLPKVEHPKSSAMLKKNNMPTMHKPCGEPNCMQCAMNVMTTYFSLLNANVNCTNSKSRKDSKHTKSKTACPPKIRKMTPVVKPKTIFVKATNVKQEPVEDTTVHVDSKYVVTKEKGKKTKSDGPKFVWVPKKD